MDNTVILTENNAFQNFGKCLQKQCLDENEMEDFLQLCIEFIFYDKTHIAGTVSNAIMNDTNEVINILKSNGYPDNIISFEDYNENIISPLAGIVENNIDGWVKEVRRVPSFIVERKVEQYLPTLKEEERKIINNTTRAVQRGEEAFDEFIRDLKQSSSFAETFYFVIFLKNKNIIEKINKINNPTGKSIINKPRWNVAMTMSIISNIRYFANRELTNRKDHYFLPSFKRGKRDYLRSKQAIPPHISELINSVIIEKAMDQRKFNIEIPSITNYIIEKGHFQPENIIKEVVKLRYDFEPVRDYIRSFVGQETIKNNKFQKELNDIAKEVFNKLKNNSSEKYIEPVKNLVTFKVGNLYMPKPEVLENNQLSVCVQAFPEVINDIKRINFRDNHKKRLFKNCVKK